jgi:hypothetical protein
MERRAGRSRVRVLLGIPPLTAEEKKSSRRFFRVLIYLDALFLLLLLLSFRNDFWEVSIGWFFMTMALATWNVVTVRRAVKRINYRPTNVESAADRTEVTKQTKKGSLWSLSGSFVLFIFGFTNHDYFIGASIVFVGAIGVLLFARSRR